MRPLHRVLGSTLTAALIVAALPSSPARAANDAGMQPSDDALSQAQGLYEQGRHNYELADYAKALELWKEAYQMLPEEPGTAAIRHTLIYNMADAETKQFEIDKDISRLRKAKMLMSEYIASHTDIYGETDEANKDKAAAEQRLAEIEAQIQQAEGGGPAAPAGAAAVAPAPTGPSPALQRRNDIAADPDLSALDRKYTGFIAGGATLLAVGSLVVVAGLAVGVANLGEDATNVVSTTTTGQSNDNIPDGAGIAVSLTGLAMMAAGIPLVAIGDSRRRKLRNPAVPLPDMAMKIQQPRFAPYGHRHGAGAAFSFRF